MYCVGYPIKVPNIELEKSEEEFGVHDSGSKVKVKKSFSQKF